MIGHYRPKDKYTRVVVDLLAQYRANAIPRRVRIRACNVVRREVEIFFDPNQG